MLFPTDEANVVRHHVSVGDEVPCPRCAASGVVASGGVEPAPVLCPMCRGKRRVVVEDEPQA
jgi:hypothetical protein